MPSGGIPGKTGPVGRMTSRSSANSAAKRASHKHPELSRKFNFPTSPNRATIPA